MAFDVIELLDT